MSYLRTAIKRWLAWFALAVVFAIACWFLSQWQLARRAEVVKVIQRIDSNYDRNPVAIDALLPNPARFALKNEYRPVEIRGSYLARGQLLVRNRPQNGTNGFEQLCAFRLTTGEIVFVDRGWLPTGSKQDSPDVIPQPPTGTVTVQGRLRHSEGTDGRQAPAGQIAFANVPEALVRVGEPSTGNYSAVYLLLSSEDPNASTPALASKPDIGEGNHLSYAFQWLLFALMGFGALAWAIRQEYLHRKAAHDPTFVIPRRKRMGDSDSEFEDGAS